MTKDVLVSISGIQMALNDMESNDDEPIEVFSAGTYYFKNGKHYRNWEDVEPGDTQEVHRLGPVQEY